MSVRPRAIVHAVTCFAVTAVLAAQAKPDFSGKWTETRVPAGQEPTVMTVTQDASTITVDVPSLTGTLRWVVKLDGSPSKNVTVQGDAQRRVEQTFTATWKGSGLAISTQARSNRDGPYTLEQLWTLEDGRLVVTAAGVSQTTGAMLRASKKVYAR